MSRAGARSAIRPPRGDDEAAVFIGGGRAQGVGHARDGQVRPADVRRQASIHVCTSGACLQDGAQATLIELEELADAVGGCTVHEYSCFGRCGHGPNASIDWDDGTELMVTGLRTIGGSVAAIRRATGEPAPEDARLLARLYASRISNWRPLVHTPSPIAKPVAQRLTERDSPTVGARRAA